MATAIILGNGIPNPRLECVTLLPKPYFKPAQLHYLLTPTKIRPFSYFKPAQLHYLPTPTKIRPFSVRACGGRAVNEAIDFSGRRVTIGEVVSKDRFKSNQSLRFLTVDTNDCLQDNGVFPKKPPLSLWSVKFESLLEKGKMALVFLMGVSFWASLAASSVVGLAVAVCVACILRIIHSPEASGVIDQNIRVLLVNLCNPQLIECVFSYVLGDGDPNQGIEEKRWKMIGQYIALNGGVVTAEEIAPYLDPAGKMDDELYMLPVLQRFDGQPKVDEEGNILYHFPSVHCTPLPRCRIEKEYVGRWVDGDIKVDKFLKEQKGKFSKVDDDSRFVHLLLIYNLFCVALSGIVLRLTHGWRSYFSLHLFLPLLLMYVIYAVSFLVISRIRFYSIQKRNDEIVKRNEAREEHAKSLESPKLSLKRKLLSARTIARRASIGNDRIAYFSESGFCEQQEHEKREWDLRFNERRSFVSSIKREVTQMRLRISNLFE